MLSCTLAVFFATQTTPQVETVFKKIEAEARSPLGAALITPKASYYNRKSERFSLQSVMKMVVAMAALDMVDRKKWSENPNFEFKKTDLSLSVQPLQDLLNGRDSMQVSLKTCIELTVTQSCSASGDFLVRKMGGTAAVNAFLKRKGISGMSVDRQERDLQTQVGGITWKPQHIDEKILEADFEQVPESERARAYKRYQQDPRDTTTPEAMGLLLKKLVLGQLLSKRSTEYLIQVMCQTQTGVDRLPAGLKPGWRLGHKTGTSSSYKGIAHATNDVGILFKPNGDWVVVVAMLKASPLSPAKRDSVIARVGKLACEIR
jgi:beta-lactamase class A